MSDFYHNIEEDLALGMVRGDRVLRHIQHQSARIEELDGIIRQGRERIEELVSMVNSKDARIEELEAKLAKAVEALRQISYDASVPVHTRKIGCQYYGVNFKKMYEGWRKIATNRKDHARAALAELKGETDD